MPCLLPVLMITLGFSCWAIYGAKAWPILMTPNIFVWRTDIQLVWSSPSETCVDMAGVGRPIPALAINTWT